MSDIVIRVENVWGLALGVSPYGLPAVVSRASSQPCLGPKLLPAGGGWDGVAGA